MRSQRKTLGMGLLIAFTCFCFVGSTYGQQGLPINGAGNSGRGTMTAQQAAQYRMMQKRMAQRGGGAQYGAAQQGFAQQGAAQQGAVQQGTAQQTDHSASKAQTPVAKETYNIVEVGKEYQVVTASGLKELKKRMDDEYKTAKKAYDDAKKDKNKKGAVPEKPEKKTVKTVKTGIKTQEKAQEELQKLAKKK
jgi:hypothetical protein